MDPAFLNEQAADQEVIKSLSSEIERLQGIIMSKVIKSEDGKYYRVRSFEEISEQEFNEELDQAKAHLAELEAIAPVAPTNEVPPADVPLPAPAPATPVADTPPAPQPAAPAEVPVAPATPAAEPDPVTLQ